MNEKTNYNGSNSYLKASLTIELVVLVYVLRADCKDEFESFYDEHIRSWLAQNSVGHANAWIVDDYLIVVSSRPMPPWIGKAGIPGLERYLKQPEPVRMQQLPKFALSPKEGAGSYADAKSA